MKNMRFFIAPDIIFAGLNILIYSILQKTILVFFIDDENYISNFLWNIRNIRVTMDAIF